MYKPNAVRWSRPLMPVAVAFLVLAGCTAGSIQRPPPPLRLHNYSTDLASCQELGAVVAEETCACYNKMTYDRLGRDVQHSLADNAKSQYSGANVVAVLDMRMYMNRAVAHGIAFRCGAGT